MMLSILIPTLPIRKNLYDKLEQELKRQAEPYGEEVEIISWDEVRVSIGAKRNALLGWAKGNYVCFVDDDDRVSENYIDLLMEGINKDVDCCSLKGIITTDGKNPEIFHHSIIYNEYKTNETGVIKYERYPNHLNCIKASIAKQFKFPETNHGEDTDFATQIHKSGLLKHQWDIEQMIYFYDYKRVK